MKRFAEFLSQQSICTGLLDAKKIEMLVLAQIRLAFLIWPD